MTVECAWLVIGMLLVLSELIVPGFVVLFFGIGALVAGGVAWWWPESTFVAQGFVFAVVSLVSLFLGRRFFRQALRGKRYDDGVDADDDGVVGAMAVVMESIEPTKPGRVEVRGVTWQASSTVALEPGLRVKVVGRKNITLIVEPMK